MPCIGALIPGRPLYANSVNKISRPVACYDLMSYCKNSVAIKIINYRKHLFFSVFVITSHFYLYYFYDQCLSKDAIISTVFYDHVM